MNHTDSRVRYINRCVRNYDYDLIAERDYKGVICVYRKNKRFDKVFDWDGGVLFRVGIDKQFVLSLTDNWRSNGNPVDWGYEQITQKLKDSDHWETEDLFQKLDEEEEKIDKSRRRHFRSEMEAALIEARPAFKKDFGDILTHSMSKDEPRKRSREKRMKNNF